MTVKEIYRMALSLLLLREGNAKDLEEHVPGILNVMLEELRAANESMTGLDRGPVRVSGMHDEVPLEPEVCCGILPYGLAARLEADEDRAKASWLLGEYTEKLHALRKARTGKVVDCY